MIQTGVDSRLRPPRTTIHQTNPNELIKQYYHFTTASILSSILQMFPSLLSKPPSTSPSPPRPSRSWWASTIPTSSPLEKLSRTTPRTQVYPQTNPTTPFTTSQCITTSNTWSKTRTITLGSTTCWWLQIYDPSSTRLLTIWTLSKFTSYCRLVA